MLGGVFVVKNSLTGNSGFLTVEQLANAGVLPSEERLAKGPVAVIECLEGIPCNPCETACVKKCIYIGEDITNLPVFDSEKCIGCGICVASCPGQAIFIEDASIGNEEAMSSFPYEYFPLPQKGSKVTCVNRQGHAVCKGIIERIVQIPKYDHTAVVTVRIPVRFVHEVRSISGESED
jgi:Fe-S-cluster-containing hydrogenase component 2